MIQLQNAQESYRQKRIDPIMVKTSNIDTLIIYYVFSLLVHIEQHTKAMIVCMPTFRKTIACSCFYFCPSNLFSTDNQAYSIHTVIINDTE